jgi:hypothetical protein
MGGAWERILVRKPEGKRLLVGQGIDGRVIFKYS